MSSYKTYQVPKHLQKELEAEATKRRMQTGTDIKWTKVLREILDLWHSKRRRKK